MWGGIISIVVPTAFFFAGHGVQSADYEKHPKKKDSPYFVCSIQALVRLSSFFPRLFLRTFFFAPHASNRKSALTPCSPMLPLPQRKQACCGQHVVLCCGALAILGGSLPFAQCA